MKIWIFVIVLFLLTISSHSFSQVGSQSLNQVSSQPLTLDQYNYYHAVSTITSSPTQTGGVILPSQGAVNVLFIFAEFPDDNYQTTDSRWPKGGYPDKYNT
ncbi:MAG: hypothetical protein ACM3S2_12490, partial [Ignavibacteriales bacterium]